MVFSSGHCRYARKGRGIIRLILMGETTTGGNRVLPNQVIAYSLSWDADHDTGIIFLKLARDQTNTVVYQLRVNSAQELAALGDILRNEKMVFYDHDKQRLTSGWTQP